MRTHYIITLFLLKFIKPKIAFFFFRLPYVTEGPRRFIFLLPILKTNKMPLKHFLHIFRNFLGYTMPLLCSTIFRMNFHSQTFLALFRILLLLFTNSRVKTNSIFYLRRRVDQLRVFRLIIISGLRS